MIRKPDNIQYLVDQQLTYYALWTIILNTEKDIWGNYIIKISTHWHAYECICKESIILKEPFIFFFFFGGVFPLLMYILTNTCQDWKA